ncbi:DUF1579 family protein [Arthrobacter sp. Soil764]|uniref:DUF1579 family protein n=1 Tax=Arthrobacter sp. Soil764 TaxID=1736403 RepID=UPI0006FD9DAC|nr:DUF1579 family protein [Arthrobacter sp. Soil764]KRE79065.1 hypothetical protein ASG86_13675 [Arthrobacter sp. Soil764]
MNGPTVERTHPGLSRLVGHWRGHTYVASGPWGPEHSVDAEVSYHQVAGGLGVVQSYRHVEPDGSHFEGHGIFTVDPVRKDVLWYYVDSTGVPPGSAARCTWRDGVLRVERPSDAGWTRHSVHVEGDILIHVTELRVMGKDDGGDAPDAGTNGKASPYRPFMRSEFHRV